MADTLPAPPPVRKPEDHRVRNNPVATASVVTIAAALASIGAAFGLDLDKDQLAAVIGGVVTIVGAAGALWARSQAWGPLSHHEAVREAGHSHPEPAPVEQFLEPFTTIVETGTNVAMPPGWGEREA